MADVVGIGSAFVDYFFESDESFLNKLNLKPEDDYLFKDKKINPKEISKNLPVVSKSPGGISANTISILSNLKLKTSYYGTIGANADGIFWESNLGHVDFSKVDNKGQMSFCYCLLTDGGKNRTFLNKVNRHELEFLKDPDLAYLNKSKIIHIGPFISDVDKGIKLTSDLIGKLKSPLISFSPSIFYIARGIDKLKPILDKTEILFLNKKEMKYLTNENPNKGSKKLLIYGSKIIVCTLGEKGAIITTKKVQFHVPRFNAKGVVDTTGAGDAFAAGFLYGILKNKPLKWSANYASRLAAESLQNYGLNWIKK